MHWMKYSFSIFIYQNFIKQSQPFSEFMILHTCLKYSFINELNTLFIRTSFKQSHPFSEFMVRRSWARASTAPPANAWPARINKRTFSKIQLRWTWLINTTCLWVYCVYGSIVYMGVLNNACCWMCKLWISEEVLTIVCFFSFSFWDCIFQTTILQFLWVLNRPLECKALT